jgi:hypothetical protein
VWIHGTDPQRRLNHKSQERFCAVFGRNSSLLTIIRLVYRRRVQLALIGSVLLVR